MIPQAVSHVRPASSSVFRLKQCTSRLSMTGVFIIPIQEFGIIFDLSLQLELKDMQALITGLAFSSIVVCGNLDPP